MRTGNFQKYKSYTVADRKATVNHAQANFQPGARTTKKGGTNKSSPQKNFFGAQGVKGVDRHARSHFGEKGGTGNSNGY